MSFWEFVVLTPVVGMMLRVPQGEITTVGFQVCRLNQLGMVETEIL